MKFSKYLVLIAILVLCLTAPSEAGFGKKFKKAWKKIGHKVEHLGQNVGNAIHKTGNAAVDVGKVVAAGTAVGAIAG